MLNLVTVESIRQNGLKLAVVAICTHKRPKMLEKCLMSLLAQEIPPGIIVHYVIVDNDAAESGRPSYIKFTNLCSHWATYIVQPKRGIAAARNSAREYAIQSDADYLMFIDDDEQADSKWIAGLLHPDYLDTPLLFGWLIYDFPPSVPAWAQPKKNKAPIEGANRFVGSGNMRMTRAVFDAISFNEANGLSGGEDEEFYTRASMIGFESKVTKRAMTFEYAHPIRYTILGILNRTHWIAAANMRCDFLKYGRTKAIARKTPSIIFCGPIALFQLIGGILHFAVHAISNQPTTGGRKRMLRAAKTIARTMGYWDAIRGHIPPSYAHTVGE